MKFYRIFIVLSVLLLSSASVQAQTNSRVRLAQALERSGNYEAALEIYQALFDSGDHSFGVQFGIRKALTSLRRYPQLIRFYQTMIRLQPGQFMNSVELGRAYALNQQKEKALQVWRDLLKKKANNAGVYQAVGRVMTELRLLDEAADVYKTAAKRFSNKSGFYMSLAQIYRAQLDYEQASFYLIEYYRANKKQGAYVRSQLNSMAKTDEAAQQILTVVRRQAQNTPADGGLREMLASMYMRLRQYEQALRIYQSLKGSWYLLNFAKEADLAGAYAFSVKAYRLALQREGNSQKSGDLRYLLARSCVRSAQKQQAHSVSQARASMQCAEEQLRILIKQQTDKRNRWRALVLLGDIQNRFYHNEEEALRVYHTVRQEAPAGKIRAGVLMKIAEIEIFQNKLDAAEKEYSAVRYAAEQPAAWYEWAKLDYYRGQFSAATQRLTKLQKRLQPQDTLTNNVLESLRFIQRHQQDSLALVQYAGAELLKRRRQWEAAAKAFGALAQTGGSLALPALEQAARIYLGRNRASEAFVMLNGFLQRNPQHPANDRVLLLLGETYETMNQPKQALNAYLTLIRSYPDSFYLEEARYKARALQQDPATAAEPVSPAQ